MKNGKKNFIGMVLIYAIILAVINILVFTIFKPGSFEDNTVKAAFWISYGFMTLAFGLQFGSLFTFRKKDGIDAVFMGIPLYTISIGYFVAELFVSLLFMILAAFAVKTPIVLVVVLQILLLAVYLVVAIVATMTRNTIASIDTHNKTMVRNIRSLVSDLDLIIDSCEDADVKKALYGLQEDIKYSDPMSTSLTAECDAKLRNVVQMLKDTIFSGDKATLLGLVKQGKFVVKERNNLIANNK